MFEPPEADVAPTTTTTFPVILYDGEREINVGNINIHPDLLFKQFQMMLSQLIGISYNNLTTYLVDVTKPKVSPDRRRILITGKVNFAAIVREKNCCFLVVLKRSRRDRRKQQQQQQVRDLSQISWNNNNNINNHELFEDRFHNMMIHRENYMNMILNSYGFDYPNFPRIEDAYPRVRNSPVNRSLCEECRIAEKQGKIAEFHHCVYDEVVVGGFRSPFGPVSRPCKE